MGCQKPHVANYRSSSAVGGRARLSARRSNCLQIHQLCRIRGSADWDEAAAVHTVVGRAIQHGRWVCRHHPLVAGWSLRALGRFPHERRPRTGRRLPSSPKNADDFETVGACLLYPRRQHHRAGRWSKRVECSVHLMSGLVNRAPSSRGGGTMRTSGTWATAAWARLRRGSWWRPTTITGTNLRSTTTAVHQPSIAWRRWGERRPPRREFTTCCRRCPSWTRSVFALSLSLMHSFYI